MWGLTGNMDPRLVSDGKALDVAYDAGEGNPKRTAEVTINGEWSREDYWCHFMLMSVLKILFLCLGLFLKRSLYSLLCYIYLFFYNSHTLLLFLLRFFSLKRIDLLLCSLMDPFHNLHHNLIVMLMCFTLIVSHIDCTVSSV